MKKYYLLLGLIVGLFACTQEDYLSEETNKNEQKKVLKQAGDGVHDLLGFSYDVTKEYLHVDAAPRSVLDIAAFKKDNPNRYYFPASTYGNTEIYSGATGIDMLEEIKTKSKVSGSLTGIPLPFGATFGGSIKKETETETKYTFSSKYSYARADVSKRVKRLYLDADVQMLLKYVHSTFYENLNRLSPDQFVAEYGTHVLTDITIGGRLTFTYRSCVTQESNSSRKKEIVEAGVKFSVGKFGADANKAHENETIKSLNTQNSSSKVWVNYHGGEQSGLSFEYDGSGALPKTNFNLASWEASVKDTNAALTDINWARTYPIYEFITDPTKKAQIKAAVERYIASKKVDEVLNIVPLIQWGNNKGVLAYTCDPNYNYGSGWSRHQAVAYVYNKPELGSKPLIQWSYKDGRIALTTDPNYNYGSGWGRDGIIAYTPTVNDSGAVPLIQWGSSVSFGYTCDPNYDYGSGWSRNGIMGYVYPVK